ncbi:cytochrome P450 [Actinomadura scrupuli]|uniref:cytochrome P450 n=1 Tax=Actinomadura scrupuli TaxID=559629 RepID=UPI003D95373C
MTAADGVEFDPFSEAFFVDPYPTYRWMRDEAPVYYNEKYDFYALTRYEDVSAALKDFETYSSARGVDLAMVQSGKPAPPLVIMMDPPEHRRMRQLVSRVFTPRAISALEPMAHAQIKRFLGQCDPAGFDVVQDFAALFPVEIITSMLGVPPEFRQQIRLWLDVFLEREPGRIGTTQKGMEALVATGAFYHDLIKKRRAEPQDDMISDLIRADIMREGGERTALDDLEIAGFATMLGGAGAETVTKLIGNAVVTFADHPDQWDALRADRTKIPAAAEEILRHQAPSQYNVRYCVRDVELHGVRIPAGSAVLLIVGAANRDERAYADADVFDIGRDALERHNLGFGYGIHSCLGAALARLESRIALDMLLDFMPRFEVDRSRSKRVTMSNVAGWASVPVRVPDGR